MAYIKRVASFPESGPITKKPCLTPAIDILPSEMLDQLFSHLKKVKDLSSALRVCKKWEQVVKNLPTWKRFRTHFPFLTQLFPHSSLDERKNSLDRLTPLLDRGRKLFELYKQKPQLRLQQNGTLFLYYDFNERDLKESRVLCSVQEGGNFSLKWLDLRRAKLLEFPFHDYLDCLNTEKEKALLIEVVKRNKIRQITNLSDRYLIISFNTQLQPFLFVIDRVQKKYYCNRLRKTDQTQSFLSGFVIWNGSIIFQLTNYNGEASFYALFRLDFSQFKVHHLHRQVLAGYPKYLLMRKTELFLVVQNESDTIYVYDHQFALTKFRPGDLLAVLPESFFSVPSDFSTVNHYFLSEGQWLSQLHSDNLTYVTRVPADPVDANVYASFSPHILVNSFSMKKKERSYEFCNLLTRDRFFSFTHPANSYRAATTFTLIGDFFLFLADNEKMELFGGIVGENLSPIAIPFQITGLYGSETNFYLFEDQILLEEKGHFCLYQFNRSDMEKIQMAP